jgi:hypothetical protein
MPDHIVCGKLDNRADLGVFATHRKAKVRLHVERRSPEMDDTILAISVGEKGVWFQDRLWKTETFLATVSKNSKRLLVLTGREYLQVVELASTYGLGVDVFENNFPIFSGIKYSSCPRVNYDVLKKHLQKLHQLKVRDSSLSKDLAQQHLRTAVRKLRFKNKLDRHFFFAYKDGYQEVFKLKEERPERVIIALDFNSMYLDSMKGKFCSPTSIEYKHFGGSTNEPSDLATGIYRVRLVAAKQSFLLDHHPFRYKRLGRSYYFRMNCGDTIETLLHKDEVAYFAPFFDRVEIVEGLFSVETIEHPLLNQGLALYAQRMYHRRRGDRVKENLCKLSIQHMHSATNQKRFAKKGFKSMKEVQEFLSMKFAMNLDKIGLDEVANFLASHKYFELTRTHQRFLLSYLDIGAGSVVFSLSAQVVANARLKLLQTLEVFLNHPSVELCYANIDSIHLSIHREEINNFLESNQSMISDRVGDLKVEAIADRGYWFDVGRYWLKKDEDVVLFKNKGFAHKAASDPFVYRRRVSNFVETATFAHLHTYVAKIENSFTYHKRLEYSTSAESRFSRFRYAEIKDPQTAITTEACEQLSSMKMKVSLLQRISQKSKHKKR